MNKYLPFLIIGAIAGIISATALMFYVFMKDKKEAIGFDRNMKDSYLARVLLHYARPYAKTFAAIGIIMLVSIVYDVVSPALIGDVEKMIKSDFELSQLFSKVAVYASILVLSLVCNYLQSIALQKVGQKIVSQIREDLFEHIEHLSHSQLNSVPVGKLVTRVTNDTYGLAAVFTSTIINMVKNFLVLFGVIVAMFMLNYSLALMVLCFAPFIVILSVTFRKFFRKVHRRVRDNTTDINSFLAENLSGMKIIQIFNREERKMEEFEAKNRKLENSKKMQTVVSALFRPTIYAFYLLATLCLLYLGGMGYINDITILGQTVESEVVVAFYLYISKFFNPIQALAEQFNFLQAAFASAEKIFTVMGIKPEIVDSYDAIELETIKGEIEFRDVWFYYVPGEWVLKGVSFKVNAGDTVALVGATGSGKTTILSLICRNYDIQRGQILIDGIDIKKIKIASLRCHFGQMLQDVFLFSGTIRSNIILGKEGVSDKEIMEACKYVNADSFIGKLEKGLDEEVRERGNNFSVGQRQLLSFARTIIHKPEVMILDEATANIDTETEMLIQESLEKMMNIGTMLIVAHRLSTVQHADCILVLSHGEIIERGNHFELIEKKGKYYELYSVQRSRAELSGKRKTSA